MIIVLEMLFGVTRFGEGGVDGHWTFFMPLPAFPFTKSSLFPTTTAC